MTNNTQREQRIRDLAKQANFDAPTMLLKMVMDLEDEIQGLKDTIAKEPPEDTKTEQVAMRLASKLVGQFRDGIDGKDGETGPEGPQGEAGVDGEVGPQGAPGKDGKDGAPGAQGPEGPQGPQGPAGSPDMAEDVRNKLELLDGQERLKIEAIRDLPERLAAIDEKASHIQTPAKAYRIYEKDASAQCDGLTKAFSVGGSHFGIVGVFGTEFPQVYRPIIDYTETRTGILLTSGVSAPQTGQTLVIQFLK